MSSKHSFLLATIALVAALAMWFGVYLFSASITTMAQDAASQSTSAQTLSNHASVALQMHAVARAVAPQVSQLQSLLTSDPLSLAGVITRAGKDAGVSLSVSDATPETPSFKGSPEEVAQQKKLLANAINFSIQGDGSFAALMRAAALLSTLPVPSMVQTLDIERNTSDTSGRAGSWHLNAHVRILTNAQVSS